MKKILVIGAVLFFGSTVSVRAVEGSSRTNFVELKKQTREEFKTKLQEIKDEKKKVTITNLNNRLCLVQKKRVEVFNKNLEVMASISARLANRLNGASNSAFDKAKVAQAEAKSAVSDFSGKSCGIVLSGDESKVRSEFQAALDLLQKDIKVVQDKLTSARKLTAEAVSSVMSTSKKEVSN